MALSNTQRVAAWRKRHPEAYKKYNKISTQRKTRIASIDREIVALAFLAATLLVSGDANNIEEAVEFSERIIALHDERANIKLMEKSDAPS